MIKKIIPWLIKKELKENEEETNKYEEYIKNNNNNNKNNNNNNNKNEYETENLETNIITKLNPKKFKTVAKENIDSAILENKKKRPYTAYTYSTIQKINPQYKKPKKSNI